MSPRKQTSFLRPPCTIDELIALCEKHGDRRISMHFATSKAGCCDYGTKDFRSRYFPGRTQVQLRELIRFITHNHYYWYDVLQVVAYKLVALGAVSTADDISYPADRWRKRLPALETAEVG